MRGIAVVWLVLLVGGTPCLAGASRERWEITVVESKSGARKSETWSCAKPKGGSGIVKPVLSYSVDGKVASKSELELSQDLAIYARAFELVARNARQYHLPSAGCAEFTQVKVGTDQAKICLPDARRAAEFNEIVASLRALSRD